MRASIRTLVKSDSGVTALEYALILALVAVVIISAIFGLGDKVGQTFDIIVAAVSDQPVPGDDPGAPGDGGGGGATGDDQSRQAPTPAPVADASARDDGGENTGGGPVAAAAEAGPAESLSGGENIGPDAGAANPSHRAAALSGEGAGAGAGGGGFSGVGGTGGTGRSQGDGTGNPGGGDTGIVKAGTGRGGEPGPAGTGETGALPGRDATSDWFWNATPSWDQSAALAPSAMAAPGGEDRSTGRVDRAGEGSDLTSILALLLGLILGLLMAILGWKKTLRTAAEKGGDKQLEGWEPLSFGQSSVPRPV